MASEFGTGAFSRPSDHGPDDRPITWECGNNCGTGFVERPPDRELSRCSQPGCGEPEGTWLCPNCRASSRCEACQEPYCREHLTPAKWDGKTSEYWCEACIKAMTCPECSELKDDIDEYDLGTEAATGYALAGRACAACRGKR